MSYMELLISLVVFMAVVMVARFAIRTAFNVAWFTAGILWKPAVVLLVILAIAKLL